VTYFDPNEYDDLMRQRAMNQVTNSFQPTQQLSDNISSLIGDYPTLSPGVLWSLASSDITGPAANDIAQQDLGKNLQNGQPVRANHLGSAKKYFTQLIDQLNAYGSGRPEYEGPQGSATQNFWKSDLQALGIYGDRLKAQQTAQNITTLLNSNDQNQIMRHYKKYKTATDPKAGPDGGNSIGDFLMTAVKGAGEAAKLIGKGWDLTGKAVDEVTPNFLRQPLHHAMEPGQTAIRTAGQVANDALQFVTDDLRASLVDSPLFGGAGKSMPTSNPLDVVTGNAEVLNNALKQTTTYQQLVNGLSAGTTGFLPDTASPAAKAAAKAAREYSPYLIGGHGWTLGRAIAQGVGLDANTSDWEALSGAIDAVVAIKFDPVSKGLHLLGEANQARTTFQTAADTATEYAKMQAAAVKIDGVDNIADAATKSGTTVPGENLVPGKYAGVYVTPDNTMPDIRANGIDTQPTGDTTNFGDGVYLSSNDTLADRKFTTQTESGLQPQKIGVTFDVTNPLNVDATDAARARVTKIPGVDPEITLTLQQNPHLRSGYDALREQGYEPSEALGQAAKDAGHDAIHFRTDTEMATTIFDKSQVNPIKTVDPTELENAGLMMGNRKWLWNPRPTEWTFSPNGRRVVEAITNTDSPYEIFQAFHGKLSATKSVELAKALTADEVRAVLIPELGSTFKQIPKFDLGYEQSRAWTPIPGAREIKPTDPDAFVPELEKNLVNARISRDVRKALIDRYLAAEGAGERYAAIKAMSEAFTYQLIKAGVPGTEAQQVASMLREDHMSAHFWVDSQTGRDADFQFAQLNGELHPLGTRHASSELLTSNVLLPDPALIRELTTKINPFMGTKYLPVYDFARATADVAMGAWKALALLRGAWTMRVLADEQIMMAARGNGVMNNPLSYVAVVLGDSDSSALSNMFRKINADHLAEGIDSFRANFSRLRTDAMGTRFAGETMYLAGGEMYPSAKIARAANPIATIQKVVTFSPDEMYQNALSKLYEPWNSARSVRLKEFVIVDKGNENWAQGMGEELNRLSRAPEFRAATNMTLPELQQSLWDGDLKNIRLQVAQEAANGEMQQLRLGQDLGPRASYSQMRGEDALARQTSDKYAQSVYDRINDLTRGHPELIDAIKTGKFNQMKIIQNNGEIPNAVKDRLNNIAENEIVGDHYVKVRKIITSSGRGSDYALMKDKVVGKLFDALMTRPSNYLSRSPEFRQVYWKEIEDMIPLLNEEGRATLLSNLEVAQLGNSAEARLAMKLKLSDSGAAGAQDLESIDQIAKRRALDDVRSTLHNMHTKSQFFEATRLLFPFGEAWKQVATRWAKAVYENPALLRRAQQAYQGGKDANIIRYDPVTQQEVVTIPGSAWLTDKIVGAPIPFNAPLKGFNMIGEGLPSVGPAISFPMSYLLPNKPQFNTVRDLIFPVGEPTGNFNDRLTQAFLPAYAQKFKTFFDSKFGPNSSDRQWVNTVTDMARYLSTTGDYDLHGADAQSETRRMLSDAKNKAGWLFLVRGMTQFISPSPPIPEWKAEDKKGNFYLVQKIADDFNKDIKKSGYDNAVQHMIDTWGPDGMFLVQSKSQTSAFGLTDKSGEVSWEQRNQDLVDKYPNVWPLFAPQTGKFDINAYNQDFLQAQRESLQPDEVLKKANVRIASFLYGRARDQMDMGGLSVAEKTKLADYKNQLTKDYPGYSNTPSLDSVGQRETAISELQSALNQPRLASTDAGQGLQEYLDSRQSATDSAHAAGVTDLWSANATRNVRAWLQSQALAVIARHPDFQTMWDELFSKEFA
jgi:hypothetical protein